MLWFILGLIIGLSIRPVMNFYTNYKWYARNSKKSFEQLVKASFRDIWSK